MKIINKLSRWNKHLVGVFIVMLVDISFIVLAAHLISYAAEHNDSTTAVTVAEKYHK